MKIQKTKTKQIQKTKRRRPNVLEPLHLVRGVHCVSQAQAFFLDIAFECFGGILPVWCHFHPRLSMTLHRVSSFSVVLRFFHFVFLARLSSSPNLCARDMFAD